MYFVVTVYSTFGRGSTGVSVFVLYLLLWVVLFSFILSHWEKYNTGILFLPWGYDISQVVSTRRSSFSRSSIKGWRARGAALVPVQPPVKSDPLQGGCPQPAPAAWSRAGLGAVC